MRLQNYLIDTQPIRGLCVWDACFDLRTQTKLAVCCWAVLRWLCWTLVKWRSWSQEFMHTWLLAVENFGTSCLCSLTSIGLQLTSETSTWNDRTEQVKHASQKLCKHPLEFYTIQLVFETWQLLACWWDSVVACSWTKADDGEKETERAKVLSQGLAQFAVDKICRSQTDPNGSRFELLAFSLSNRAHDLQSCHGTYVSLTTYNYECIRKAVEVTVWCLVTIRNWCQAPAGAFAGCFLLRTDKSRKESYGAGHDGLPNWESLANCTDFSQAFSSQLMWQDLRLDVRHDGLLATWDMMDP